MSFIIRPFITIFLLPLVFISTVIAGFDMHEVEKIGGIWDHYQHHVIEYGEADLTFLDFLADHFSSDATPEQEHENLPLIGGGHQRLFQPPRVA